MVFLSSLSPLYYVAHFPAHKQGHPRDRFGGISVRKTCNRLKFSVREMSSRAFLIQCLLMSFVFGEIKMTLLGTKIGQLGLSERQ